MKKGLAFGLGVFVALFLLTELLDLGLYAVTSASMSPAIPVGSLVVVLRATPSSLREGEVITFLLPDGKTRVTHRVVEASEGRILTKGDANEQVDGIPVGEENLVGRVVLSIPKGGYVLLFLLSREGKLALLGVALLLVLFSFLEERAG